MELIYRDKTTKVARIHGMIILDINRMDDLGTKFVDLSYEQQLPNDGYIIPDSVDHIIQDAEDELAMTWLSINNE